MRRLDDSLGDPFQLSHLVVGAQVKAVDHLVASRNLIFKAGTLHPWAALSLARDCRMVRASGPGRLGPWI